MPVQPVLTMSAAAAARIRAGTAYQIGGVIREIGTGRLVEFLQDAVAVDEPAKEAVRQGAQGVARSVSRLDLSKIRVNGAVLKTAGGAAGLVVLGGGFLWARKRRSTADPATEAVTGDPPVLTDRVDVPECLNSFRASLRRYVEAGTAGQLDAGVIAQLLADLDVLESYSGEGAITFTFEELRPFFEMVTAHTPKLAAAVGAETEPIDDTASHGENGVVLVLRRHLDAQRTLLSNAS